MKNLNKSKILIVKCEYYSENSEINSEIPEEVLYFQKEWYDNTGYMPLFFDYLNQEDEIKSIITKDHIVIIPMYYHPSLFSNKFIYSHKNKCKEILAMGPLAISNPLDIIKNIKVNGILGLEPVYSILYDKNRILRNNIIPKNFYKNEKKYLPKINNQYKIKNNTFTITPGINIKCNKKCSFCKNIHHDNYEKIFTNKNIINKIPNNIKSKNINIKLAYCNIFQNLTIDKIQKLIDSIQNKINFKSISLWTDPKLFLKFHDKILLQNKNIIWNIGFESFSESQLKRYNCLSYKNKEYNYKCIEIINNTKNYRINPLFIFFDPWSKPEELSETIKGYSKIKKQKMTCHVGGIIWKRDIIDRIWIPYPNCEMYKNAQKEQLLNFDNLNEFGRQYSFDKKYYKDWPWKFKYEKTKEVYFQLIEWINIIESYKMNLIKNKKSKCLLCSGGFVYKDFININNGRFMFANIENSFIEYLDGNENIKEEITHKIHKTCNDIIKQWI